MVKVALAQTDGPETPKSPAQAPAKKKRRWGLKLFVLTLLLIAGAPSLLTVSGQAGSLLSRIHPELGKTVRFRNLKLHWWAPVELSEGMIPVADETLADTLSAVQRDVLLETARLNHPELEKINAKLTQLSIERRWAAEKLRFMEAA